MDNNNKNDINIKDLECPVCFNYVQIPIMMCINKHTVCAQCMTQLSNCPMCRVAYATGIIENEELRDKVQGLKVPCKNEYSGCTSQISFVYRQSHETNCPHTMLLCPFSTPTKSCMHVHRDHLAEHCCRKHNSKRIVNLHDHKVDVNLFHPRAVNTSFVYDRNNVFFLYVITVDAVKVTVKVKVLGTAKKISACCLKVENFSAHRPLYLRPVQLSNSISRWSTSNFIIPRQQTTSCKSFRIQFISKSQTFTNLLLNQ